ncbi:ABC transporter substrate-binding protein [Mesorhizobium sp. A556]
MTMLDRRQFLATTAILFAARPAFSQSRPVSIALDWTPNTNHIGLFVAQAKGFYAEAGLNVSILPYSDTAAGTLVANHVADFGVLSSLALFTQRTTGADLVATYAISQAETGRIVFKAGRTDIQRPKDLDGKIYGGFGSDWEKALIGSIIRNDGGTDTFKTVTLGTSAYEALANGAVDFTLEVYTWEGVKAELDGKPQRSFRYADFGVPDQHPNFIGSSRSYLDKNQQTATDFITATRRGYAYAVDHPDEAADMLVAANSDALTDRALVSASLQALIDGHYLTSANGVIGTIDPAKMEGMGSYLFDGGILRDGNGDVVKGRLDYSRYYTNEYQGERP